MRHVQQSGCLQALVKICVVGIGNFSERLRAPALVNMPMDYLRYQIYIWNIYIVEITLTNIILKS